MTDNKRLTHIDVAKGLGIFLVVFGHALVFSGYVESLMFATIYSFHMPFFFFISGYLYKRKDANSYFSSKIKTLLFPVLVYQSINLFLYFLTWCCGKTKLYKKISFGGFWFIITLLFIVVMHYVFDTIISNRITKPKMKILILIFISFVFLLTGLIYASSISDQPNQPIATAFVGLFFYELGVILNCASNTPKKGYSTVTRIVAFVIGVSLLVVLYFTSKINSVTVDMNTSRYGKVWIFVSQAIIEIAGLYLVSLGILKNKILQYLGRNSLVILMIHIPITKFTPYVVRNFEINKSITLLICTSLSIGISLLAAWLFEKHIPILAGKYIWEKNDGKEQVS